MVIHNLYYILIYVTGFAKTGLIRTITNIQKYNFEIYNSTYLENDQSCLHVFLHKYIAIQSNSLYLLYTGQQLAGFPPLQIVFYLHSQYHQHSYRGEDGGRAESHKVVKKCYVFTKNSQITPLVQFSPPHVAQSSLIYGQTHQPVVW